MGIRSGDLVRIDIHQGFYINLRDADTWQRIEDLTLEKDDICLVLQERTILNKIPYQEIQLLTPKNQIGWLTDQHLIKINENR